MTTVISDGQALAEFRSTRFSAAALGPQILAHDVTLIDAPVGTGKSTLLDNLLDFFCDLGVFDLIVVLAALTVNLAERRLVREPTPQVRLLRPRPREDCGPLDVPWRWHERGETTAYAKQTLCRSCPLSSGCFWPSQLGSDLKGARFIFGNQEHLLINPNLITHLRRMTGAKSVLLLLDEATFLVSPLRTKLTRMVLTRFMEAVSRANLPDEPSRSWLYQTNLLINASTADLRSPGWSFPQPSAAQTLAIQKVGLARYPDFQWPGHDLHAFSRTRTDRRWRDPQGNVVFVRTPYLAEKTVLFSAGMSAEYVKRQLAIDAVTIPLAGILCQHRDTRFYNICSLLGAASRFHGNHTQILDVIAQLILRNIKEGRSTLLVSRKRLKALCKGYLERRLSEWGSPVEVYLSNGEPPPHPAPAVLPLIHYGINGVNSFEDYDTVYCLNSYYIDQEVLRNAIADVEGDDLRFPIEIRVSGRPRRRVAATFDERLRFSSGDQIVREYHRQLETNVVIQAVGRVRYATRPREVVTFQCSELPGVILTREFHCLREVREHFGLLTGSEFDRRREVDEVRRLKAEGLTAAAIAGRLGVSERTIYNRLKQARGGVE